MGLAKVVGGIGKYKMYIKNTSLYLLATATSSLLSLILSPFLALNMTPEDFAIVGYYTSFNSVFLVTLNLSLITYYVRNFMLFSEAKRKQVVDTLMIAFLLTGVIGSIFLYIVFSLYFYYAKVSIDISPYFYIMLISTIFNNYFLLLQADYKMRRNALAFFKLTLLSAIMLTIFSVLFVIVFKWGATGKLGAVAATSIVMAVVSIYKIKARLSFCFQIFKEALRFCWPLVLSAYLWYLFSSIDRPLLEPLHDMETLGYYSIGFSISVTFSMIYTAIYNTFEPDIYRYIAERNRRKLYTTIGLVILLNAIPCLLFLPFGEFIVRLLTYGRYPEATDFAVILVLKNITMSFYYPIVAIIVGLGKSKADLVIRIVGVAICIPMYLVLIDKFRFYGAAWGQVLSFVILSILGAIYLLGYRKRENKSKRSSLVV